MHYSNFIEVMYGLMISIWFPLIRWLVIHVEWKKSIMFYPALLVSFTFNFCVLACDISALEVRAKTNEVRSGEWTSLRFRPRRISLGPPRFRTAKIKKMNSFISSNFHHKCSWKSYAKLSCHMRVTETLNTVCCPQKNVLRGTLIWCGELLNIEYADLKITTWDPRKTICHGKKERNLVL